MIDIAADLGCTLGELGERFTGKELCLWLARYMMREGFTYDQIKIQKAKTENFLNKARKSWGK